jgi:hypothetical protein
MTARPRATGTAGTSAEMTSPPTPLVARFIRSYSSLSGTTAGDLLGGQASTTSGGHVPVLSRQLKLLRGCGELTAAKIVGETAGITRFKSEAAFARHAGVAPIPVWSGNTRAGCG